MTHDMQFWLSLAVIFACFGFAIFISRGPRPKP
jgi:hypothetical protein